MSFGFSLGDFLAVIELAIKIKKDFEGAPSAYKAAVDIAGTAAIVVNEAALKADDRDLTDEQRRHGQEMLDGCSHSLTELGDHLARLSNLGGKPTGTFPKLKKVWKQLTFEPDDIRDLRTRVSENLALLTGFLAQQTSSDVVVIRRFVQIQEDQAVLDWLSSASYATRQDQLTKERQKGTGGWLLTQTAFSDWIEHPGHIMCCQGVPGAGKTMLTSVVVNELYDRFHAEPHVAIAYIYSDHKRQNEQDLEHFIANLLKQICQNRSTLPAALTALHATCSSTGRRPTVDQLSATFTTIAANFQRVFILADALDECRTTDGCRGGLIEWLLQCGSSGLNIMATTRVIPPITNMFSQDVIHDIRTNQADLQAYVAAHISELPDRITRDDALKQKVIVGVADAAADSFLLAKLHFDSLKGCTTPKRCLQVLQGFAKGPKAYDAAYLDATKRIEAQPPGHLELAKNAMAWVVFARRPLRCRELQHALAIEAETTEFDEDNVSDIDDIVTVCLGLLTVDAGADTVRMIHYTAQEYFQRERDGGSGGWLADLRPGIIELGATYLMYDVFRDSTCSTEYSLDTRLLKHALHGYLVEFWGQHIHGPSDLNCTGLTFLHSTKQMDSAVQVLMRQHYDQYIDSYPRHFTGLHYASYRSTLDAVEAMLQHTNVNAQDSGGQTALFWATIARRDGVVELLINKGADPNLGAERYSPLHRAVLWSEENIVRILIRGGASVNFQDEYGETPLMLATSDRHESIARLLLDGGAEVELHSDAGATALHSAAVWGSAVIVSMLLESGANVDAKDFRCMTPLHEAAKEREFATIEVLVEWGADVNARTWSGDTPLILAVSQCDRSLATMRLLLSLGADPKIATDGGQTALDIAEELHRELLLDSTQLDATESSIKKAGEWELIVAELRAACSDDTTTNLALR